MWPAWRPEPEPSCPVPFPLAHPVVVLPLRRFCPRFLSLPALVVGSLCPDIGYAFAWLGTDEVSHRFVGSFVFCLPVGLLLVWMFAVGRERLVRLAPVSCQPVVRPLCSLGIGAPMVVVLSVLVGTWTHLLLDSFTNLQGDAALFFKVLQVTVGSLAGRQISGCHLIWYLFSFLGVTWLLLAYEGWMVREETGMISWRPGRVEVADVLVLAAWVLPMGAVHHMVPGPQNGLIVAGLTLVWGGAVVATLRRVLAAAWRRKTREGKEDAVWFARKESWVPTWRSWALIVLLVVGVLAPAVRSVNRFLTVTQPAAAAEVLVVEGWMPDSVMPSVVAEFKRGGYQRLITTGLGRPDWWTDERYPTGAEITAATLVFLGIPTNRLVTVPPRHGLVRDRTYGSAQGVKKWLEGADITVDAVNVYSLGPHSRRTRLLFQKALGDKIKVGIFAHPSDSYDAGRWWSSLQGFTEVASEGVAYLYARVLFDPR